MFEVFEATTDDQKQQLYRLRYEVFTREQHKYVASADHGRHVLVDALDEKAVHLCLAKSGEIIGSMRSVRGRTSATEKMERNFSLESFSRYRPENFAFSGRLLLKPEHRGSRGLLPLLRAAYASALASGARVDFIFCNPHLVRFYEQLGYRRYRPYFEDPDLGFQIPMVLLLDDLEHLEAIRSPFLGGSTLPPACEESAQWFRSHFPEYRSAVLPNGDDGASFAQALGRKVHSVEIPLFDGLSQDEIEDITVSATLMTVEPGTRLVRRGDMGQEMFMILQGVAEVRRDRAQGDLVLATLGRGDVFGEMSVLSSRPRSANVVAQTELEVMFIDQATLGRLVQGKAVTAAKLLRNLCCTLSEKLERTSALMADAHH